MKKVISNLLVCVLIASSFSVISAEAESGVRCAQRQTDGNCTIEVRAPGSGGQPGKPGKSPARPRERTGTGDTGGDSEEKPPGHIEGCIRYELLSGECLIFEPSESPDPRPAGAPEPVVLARVAVERMDLHAPDIGLWPHPLEELPDGYNYVGWNNWMWIKNPNPNTWGPITKTVTQSGHSITATAAVTHLTWEMGNGDTKTCGKGVEHPEHNTRNEKSPGCGYVYHQTGNYTITATAHWAIVWTGLGQQGTIEMDLTTQAHTKVVEVSAVNIPNDRYPRPSQSPLPPGPTGTPTKEAPCPTNHNKHGC